RSVSAYRAPGYPELAPDLAGDARVPERRAALGESCAPAQTNESPVPPVLHGADDGLNRFTLSINWLRRSVCKSCACTGIAVLRCNLAASCNAVSKGRSPSSNGPLPANCMCVRLCVRSDTWPLILLSTRS